MVNGVEGLVAENREGAGGKGADEKRAEKTGGMSDGDSVNIVPIAVGIF